MKNTAAVITLIFTFVTSHAMATETTQIDEKPKHQGKEAGVVIGSAFAGAAIAGPIGYAVGTGIGAWLSKRVVKSYEVDDVNAELTQARIELAEMDAQLAKAEETSTRYQRLATDSLKFQIMFLTGDATLAAGSSDRMTELAEFLVAQPNVRVILNGYADPRGDDSYNLMLSQQRVDSVTQLLTSNGVTPDRITGSAYGKSRSSAPEGNLDLYALERRVTIELIPTMHEAELAAADQP